MKVVPQASNCREIQVGNTIYRRKRTGLFDMPDAAAKYTILNEGGQLPSLSGTTRTGEGFRCLNCGFGTFFKTCSRCGGNCEREHAS